MSDPFSLCVVDTNVPLAANGSSDAGDTCMLACVDSLENIIRDGHIVLDNLWLILKEYMHRLSPTGRPGVGNRFLKWVLTNQRNPQRCTLVPITPKSGSFQDGTPLDFEEFPDHPGLQDFHRWDRMFVAVSAAHAERPPILQATDSKWCGWKDALGERGIQVEFLCPKEIAGNTRRRWAVRNA